MFALLLLALLAAQPEPPAPPPPAGAFRVEERNDDLRFAYGWGAEVQEFPALLSLLEGRRDAARLREFERARASRSEEAHLGSPPVHDYEQEWRALGRGGPLLSLVALVSFYRGGAHGSAQFEGLLWDQTSGRSVGVGDLFAGDWGARFTPRYCEALNRERLEKLGGTDGAAPPDMRTDCPELAEHVVLPEDTDANGRFDTLRVFLPPYAAGSYVEGTYEPAVPFTRADVEAVRAELREHFEVLGRPTRAGGR